MRHSSTLDSARSAPARSSLPNSLHPVLGAALANLDIRLDAELTRYRRQKAGEFTSRSRDHRAAPKLELIAISAETIPQSPGSLVSQSAAVSNLASPSEGAIAPPSSDLALTSGILTTQPETDLQHSPPPDADEIELDDYLESSEELLRSLSEEEAQVQAERGFMQSLLTPLGVGSMLLLLLSSAMFGYVVMNPSSLGHLFAARDAAPSEPAASPTPGLPANAPQPNLAAQEFKDLNLNTLGTLKSGSKPVKPSASRSPAPTPAPTAPQSSPEAVRSPATPSEPVRNVEPAPESAPRQSQPDRPVAPEPVAQPEPAPVRESTPAPPVQPAPPEPSSRDRSASEAYRNKITVPYTGDSSLEAARKVAPDAYVTNFPDGAKIQLGATTESAEAEARAQKLRDQGLPAQVQKR